MKNPTKIWIAIVVLLLLQEVAAISWSVEVKPNTTIMQMGQEAPVPFAVNVTDVINFTLVPDSDKDIATVNVVLVERNGTVWHGYLNVTGIFLGSTRVSLSIAENGIVKDTREVLTVTVIRPVGTIDNAFTASVIILVSILYINFGCAMDWSMCTKTLRRPIGPAIGFFCQFFFMPLLSYFIGYFLFPNRPELQIGMFFTGISPSGGASNIWTVLLEGNLSLSVTMTTICTIAAFGMMPFWIFTLGRRIFERGEIVIPYSRIATFATGLVIPLAIGYFIQKKLPKLSKLLVRIMKPFSMILIAFIIVFAILTNLYLFKLFSLEIVIAGMGLPWLGFTFGLIVAALLKQPWPDTKAIAIETGVQNTGVAIFLLRLSLEAPAADLTTVIPVSSAIMTPIPLAVIYLAKLVYDRRRDSRSVVTEPSLEKLQNAADISTISRRGEN